MGCTYSAPHYIPPSIAKMNGGEKQDTNVVDNSKGKVVISKKTDTIAKKMLKKLYGF